MKIFVDADACPVINIVEKIAKEKSISITLICDINHQLSSDYSDVITVSQGKDSADMKIVNLVNKGDIVVTQDYGVAAMSLSKCAFPIHQSGLIFTNDNIDMLLLQRHEHQKLRRSHSKLHIKGPKKRTNEDDILFEKNFRKLISDII